MAKLNHNVAKSCMVLVRFLAFTLIYYIASFNAPDIDSYCPADAPRRRPASRLRGRYSVGVQRQFTSASALPLRSSRARVTTSGTILRTPHARPQWHASPSNRDYVLQNHLSIWCRADQTGRVRNQSSALRAIAGAPGTRPRAIRRERCRSRPASSSRGTTRMAAGGERPRSGRRERQSMPEH